MLSSGIGKSSSHGIRITVQFALKQEERACAHFPFGFIIVSEIPFEFETVRSPRYFFGREARFSRKLDLLSVKTSITPIFDDVLVRLWTISFEVL